MRKIRKWLSRSVTAATTFVLLGCAAISDQSSAYKFELVGKPIQTASGLSVAVRFEQSDGSPVSGAQVFATRWVGSGGKAPSREQLTPMQREESGRYVYTSEALHNGDTLHLAARLQPDGDLIHGSIEVP